MQSAASKAKQGDLKAKMLSLGIKEEDIEEKFIPAQGKGDLKIPS